MPSTRPSLRLFESDLLERATFAGPTLIAAVWMPLIALSAYYGIAHSAASLAALVATGVAALLAWTLFEYAMHRFVFHFRARSPVARRLMFLLHGCHHADPQDKRRNVMSPLVSLLVGGLVLCVLLAGFAAAGDVALGEVAFAGFMAGYLTYDMTHYACHQLDLPWLRTHKRRHLAHHFAGQEANFAVTLPLWDRLLGTGLAESPRLLERRRQRVDDGEHP